MYDIKLSSVLKGLGGALTFLLLIFVFVGLKEVLDVCRTVKNVRKLNQTGTLIKDLPYRLEKTRTRKNNIYLYRIVVDYTLPTGVVIPLNGYKDHYNKIINQGELVDLIIDLNDMSKYFIDFDINRK